MKTNPSHLWANAEISLSYGDKDVMSAYLILFLLLLLHELPELKVDEDIQTGEDRGQNEEEKQPQVNQLKV